MSESQFHRNHAQHISLSELLTKELKETGQDALKQINDLDQKTSDRMLIKVVNIAVSCIYGIIPDLQEIVIKCSNEKENCSDLKVVIKKLNKYCYKMVESYDSDSQTLKQEFVIFIQNILADADDLLNIIKKNELHDFKHELVENLKEIMVAIRRVKFRIQVENYNQEELKNLVNNIQKQYVQEISIIENCNPEVLKTVASHIKYNAKHGIQIAYNLNKVASNYHDIAIERKILESAKLLNTAATSFLIVDDKFTNNKEAVKALAQFVLNCWNSVSELFDLIDIRLENEQNSENLSDLAKYVVSYGVVLTSHTGKAATNDSLFVQ